MKIEIDSNLKGAHVIESMKDKVWMGMRISPKIPEKAAQDMAAALVRQFKKYSKNFLIIGIGDKKV